MAKQNMYCPKHYTSGSQLGDCQIGIVPCPDPLPIDPAKVVEVSCGLCDKKLAIPLEDIMKKKLSGLGNCVSDQCAATIMLPKAPAAKVTIKTVTKEVTAPIPEGKELVDTKYREELEAAADKLGKLEAGGVDNWQGYDEAMSGDLEE